MQMGSSIHVLCHTIATFTLWPHYAGTQQTAKLMALSLFIVLK